MQQFGGTKAEFPNLWGDIPPRPFLGLSIEDEIMIRQTLESWLK
jgi:phage gpG-like protein